MDFGFFGDRSRGAVRGGVRVAPVGVRVALDFAAFGSEGAPACILLVVPNLMHSLRQTMQHKHLCRCAKGGLCDDLVLMLV